MFCPTCGQELPDQAKFCTGCGANIAQTPAAGVSPSAQTQTIPVSQQTSTAAGTSQGVAATPGVTGQVQAQSDQEEKKTPAANMSKRKKGLIAGLGSAVAVAIIAIVVVSVMAPGSALAVNEDNFPDETFRAYVTDNVDKDKNGKLSQKEIDAVTSIDMSSDSDDDAKVADLTGIHHFRALRNLNMHGNHLQGLPPHFGDLRYLRVLDVSHNKITKKVVVTNESIQRVYIGGNEEGAAIEVPEKADVITDPEIDESNDPDVPDWESDVDEDDAGDEAVAQSGDGDEEETSATTGGDKAAESADGEDAADEQAADEDAESKDGAASDSDDASSADGESEEPAVQVADVMFAVQDDSGNWGYVDQSGNELAAAEYSGASPCSEGVAALNDGRCPCGQPARFLCLPGRALGFGPCCSLCCRKDGWRPLPGLARRRDCSRQ